MLLACVPATAPVEVTPPDLVVTRPPNPTVVAPPPPPSSPPQACPEPHTGARLRAAPDLRVDHVATWNGIDSLRSAVPYPDLAGEVTGLLYSLAYANGYGDCRTVGPDVRTEYRFTSGPAPSHALYFPSQGDGYGFIPDWQVPLPDGSIARYDAAMLGPRSGARHCLHACAHLVTLEVNSGRGNRGLHFVATAVKVRDADLPLSFPDVLDDLHARFLAARRAEDSELRRQYDEARRTLPAAVPLGDRKDGPVRVEPTWLPDTATLDVLVWRDGQAAGERRTGSETIPPANCPHGSPCAYRESGTFDLLEQASIRHEVAARYLVDRTGLLLAETHYPPRLTATSGTSRRRR